MKRFKMLGVGRSAVGYTIVEALIFLAVSGALLVSAGAVISGRQERTRFAQSIDDTGQHLQDIFNDVSTGYYPSANNITCSVVGNPAISINIGSGAAIRGTNQDCVFAGKLLEFPVNSTDYRVYTLVSNRNATSLSSSIVEMLGVGGNQGIFDTRSNNIDLKMTKLVEVPSGTEYSSLVVLSDFGNVTGASVSGNAGKLKLYGYTQSINSGILTVNDPSRLVPINDSSNVVICLEQDGNDASRVGSITISPQLTIDRQIGTQESVCTT